MEELFNVKDVQKILKCSLSLVYAMAERGQLRCVRWECPGTGRRRKEMLRFEKGDVIEFIERHKNKPS